MTNNLKLVGQTAPVTDDDTIKRIDRYVTSPPENSRIFLITPAVALHILETYNHKNRPKKPAAIAVYAQAMQSGEWWVTGDTLKFSDALRLADGQNRLMACVRSGKSFTTHIVFGISDEAFIAMDQGKKRDGSDMLFNAGYTNTSQLASAVRWTWLIEEGRAKQRDTLKPAETLHLMEERYTGLKAFIPPAAAIYRLTGQPAGLVAACFYCFAKAAKDKIKAQQFVEVWLSGDYRKGSRVVFAKLQKEIGRLQNASSGRVHDVVRAALIVQTWNAFVDNRKGLPADFKWKPDDDFPAIKS